MPSEQAVMSGLRRRLPGVSSFAHKGSLEICAKELTGFFCSVRAPGNVILKTYDLARSVRDFDITFIGGFQSPMEREFLDFYLRGRASAVVCPARGLERMRIPKSWRKPVDEGRLLLLSFFGATVRRASAETAAARNAYAAALSARIFIACAEEGGKTEALCKNSLARKKPIFTLDSPANARLAAMGAVPVPASAPDVLAPGAVKRG